MLKNITMENFLSFREKTHLNFEKSNYQFLEEKNTINKITKGSFFIGANASGKTNCIKGIKILLELLFSHSESSIDDYSCRFSNNNSIELTYEFVINESQIIYKIIRDVRKETFTEKLELNGHIILDRIAESAKYYSIVDDDYEIFKDIDDNSLFLREVYFSTKFREYPDLNIWFNYLKNSIYINAREKEIGRFTNSKLMLKEYLEENGTEKLNEALHDLTGEFQVEYSKNCSGKNIVYINDENSIFIRRKRIDEPFPLDYESEGTGNLLSLLPSFLHVIENNGMLIIDEFSSAFHNFLERILVQFFYDNAKEAQLFLVTHATNLLSSEILRPDQVFTFNFEDDNGTKAIKVSEYAKPRTGQNFEKMYLSGMFEGIPSYE